MITSNVTDMVKPDKIADTVEAVQQAIEAAAGVYAAVERYETKSAKFHGKSASTRFNNYRWDNMDRITKQLHAEGWAYLLKRFEPFMSGSEKAEWEKLIERGDTPELTQEAAIETMRAFIDRTPENITARIRECFESMRPWAYEDLKTNKANAFRIGKRYIKHGALYSYCRSLTLYGEKFFGSLDLAFNLLDGKGVPKYPHDLCTFIRDALHERKLKFENDYFKFKRYENGNIHIEFKRMDLVDRLNRIGSGGKFELDKGVENVV